MKRPRLLPGMALAFFLTVFCLLAPWRAYEKVLAQHQGHGDPGSVASNEAPPLVDEGSIPATIEIPPEQQEAIGLKTAIVSVMPLTKIIRTVGRIEYDERKLATVNAKFAGWIETLHADYTGRTVTRGEPLAEIYSPDLYATQLDLINALASEAQTAPAESSDVARMLTADARSLRKAAEQRLRLWDLSEQQIAAIKAGSRPQRTITIYSPVAGSITQKMAVQGMRLMPGDKLFDIADLSSVWVLADVYENELALIRVGQKAVISLSYLPGHQLDAIVEYINPVLSEDTRTVKIRFTIPNPGGQLKPQMFTKVQISIDIGSRLAIPEDAIIDTGARQIVYVDHEEGRFEPREVTLGVTAAGFREVVQGLRQGERVAAAATFLIDSEAQLKGVIAPAAGGTTTP